MISKRDVQLGKIALKQGMIDKEQLTRCLALQKKLAAKGKKAALGSLLLKKEYITKEQLEEIVQLHNEALEDDGGDRKRSRRRERESARQAEADSQEREPSRRAKQQDDEEAEGEGAKRKKAKKKKKKVGQSKPAPAPEDDEASTATATSDRTQEARKASARSKRPKSSREARSKAKRAAAAVAEAAAAAAAAPGSESQSESEVGVDPAIFQSAQDSDVETEKRRLIGCPECGKKYRVKRRQVGKRFGCRRCNYRVKVPRDLFQRPLKGNAGGVEVEEFVLASSDQASSGELEPVDAARAAAAAAAAAKAVKTIGAKTSIRELAQAAEKHVAKPIGPKATFGVKGLVTMVLCLGTVAGIVVGIFQVYESRRLAEERLTQERIDAELQRWREKVDAALAKTRAGMEAKNPDAIGAGLAELEIARDAKRSLYQGKNQERAASYEREQDLDGQVRDLYVQRGQLILQRGGLRAVESIEEFEKAAALDPKHEPTQLALARSRLQARRYRAAADGLAEVQEGSQAARALAGLAWELGDAPARAVKAYEGLQDPLGPVLVARAHVVDRAWGPALEALGKAQGLTGADLAAAKIVESLAREGNGDLASALACLEQAAGAAPELPFPWLARAALRLRSGRETDKALADARKGNTLGATAWGYALQGEAHLASLQLEQAVAAYREAVQAGELEGRRVAGEVDPFQPPLAVDWRVLARCRLAFAQAAAGQLDAARVEISRARADSPFSPYAQAALTQLELLQPEPQLSPDAEALFRRALDLSQRAEASEKESIRSRESGYLLLVYGSLLIHRARYGDAVQALQRASALDPLLAVGSASLTGLANRKNSQVTSSREAYREASRLEVADPAYQEALRQVDAGEVVPARLEEIVQALLVRNPYSSSAYVLRARVRARRKESRPALDDLERALLLNPELSLAYTTRALLFLRDLPESMQDPSQAGRDADQALELERQQGRVTALSLFAKGLYHSRREEAQAALQALDACLKTDAGFADGYKLRAKVYKQLGQLAKAEQDLKRYQELTK